MPRDCAPLYHRDWDKPSAGWLDYWRWKREDSNSWANKATTICLHQYLANQRANLRLYYGARNLQTMAFQDRFTNWESCGLKIVLVLSWPDDSWNVEWGYV